MTIRESDPILRSGVLDNDVYGEKTQVPFVYSGVICSITLGGSFYSSNHWPTQ
jgi:hypothetical protein